MLGQTYSTIRRMKKKHKSPQTQTEGVVSRRDVERNCVLLGVIYTKGRGYPDQRKHNDKEKDTGGGGVMCTEAPSLSQKARNPPYGKKKSPTRCDHCWPKKSHQLKRKDARVEGHVGHAGAVRVLVERARRRLETAAVSSSNSCWRRRGRGGESRVANPREGPRAGCRPRAARATTRDQRVQAAHANG